MRCKFSDFLRVSEWLMRIGASTHHRGGDTSRVLGYWAVIKLHYDTKGNGISGLSAYLKPSRTRFGPVRNAKAAPANAPPMWPQLSMRLPEYSNDIHVVMRRYSRGRVRGAHTKVVVSQQRGVTRMEYINSRATGQFQTRLPGKSPMTRFSTTVCEMALSIRSLRSP